MGRREYITEGGMRLHLDDPVTDPLMAQQIARGRLRPVKGQAPDVTDGDKSLVVEHGSQATTADRVGVHVPAPAGRPGGDAPAKEWATYAVRLGLLATHATSMTVTQLQEWVDAHEEAFGEGEPAPVPAVDATSPDAVVPDETSGPAQAGRPQASAKVAEWRGYAVSLGLDPDEAKGMSKTDLQAWADSHQPGAGQPEPDAGGGE